MQNGKPKLWTKRSKFSPAATFADIAEAHPKCGTCGLFVPSLSKDQSADWLGRYRHKGDTGCELWRDIVEPSDYCCHHTSLNPQPI